MVEQLTSFDIINWLKIRQPIFTQALMEFGQKYDRGFDHGEFTGQNLCTIAVSIMEEGLRRKFKENIETSPHFFSAFCVGSKNQFKSLPARPHYNLHFKVRAETGWFLADPTYRQFHTSINPYEMLIGEKSEAQDRLYSLQSRPVPIRGGYMYTQHLMRMRIGDFEGIRSCDYQNLLYIFSSD